MAKSMKKYYFLLTILLVVMVGVPAVAQRPASQATPTPGQKTAGQPAPTPAAPTPAASAAGNVTLPMSKMGVIYTEAFLDQKSGILKFNSLITKLNSEFQKAKDELNQMQQRAQQLQDEITKLQSAQGAPIDQKSLQSKVDQLEQLKKDIQRKGEDAQGAYNRRRAELFAPLQEEIGRALEAFAKARSINVIIDGTQVPLIYAADSIDITQAFIIEFNSKNPVTASTTPPR
jgi:Skp family chaperone for outer membrane proteins